MSPLIVQKLRFMLLLADLFCFLIHLTILSSIFFFVIWCVHVVCLIAFVYFSCFFIVFASVCTYFVYSAKLNFHVSKGFRVFTCVGVWYLCSLNSTMWEISWKAAKSEPMHNSNIFVFAYILLTCFFCVYPKCSFYIFNTKLSNVSSIIIVFLSLQNWGNKRFL